MWSCEGNTSLTSKSDVLTRLFFRTASGHGSRTTSLVQVLDIIKGSGKPYVKDVVRGWLGRLKNTVKEGNEWRSKHTCFVFWSQHIALSGHCCFNFYLVENVQEAYSKVQDLEFQCLGQEFTHPRPKADARWELSENVPHGVLMPRTYDRSHFQATNLHFFQWRE